MPTITRWVRRRRETGGLAATLVPGPPAVKLGALLAAVPEWLAERPDATLAEQGAGWWEVSGVEASTTTMGRALRRLHQTRKKSR